MKLIDKYDKSPIREDDLDLESNIDSVEEAES